MSTPEQIQEIKYHIDCLAKLGVVIKVHKKRTYELKDKGLAWQNLIAKVKNDPDNTGKSMREIMKIASSLRNNVLPIDNTN